MKNRLTLGIALVVALIAPAQGQGQEVNCQPCPIIARETGVLRGDSVSLPFRLSAVNSHIFLIPLRNDRLHILDASGVHIRTLTKSSNAKTGIPFTHLSALQASADNVDLFDRIARRWTRLTFTGDSIAAAHLPAIPISSSTRVVNDTLILLGGTVPTPSGFGFTTHGITTNGELTNLRIAEHLDSEGRTEPVVLAIRGDTVFVLPRNSRHVEEWLVDFGIGTVHKGRVFALTPEASLLDAGSPRAAAIVDAEFDERGFLWVSTSLYDPSSEMVAHSILEVLDVAAGELIATAAFDEPFGTFIGPRALFTYGQDSSGPVVRTWVVTLTEQESIE